jgi:8-oxo-dGTP pyrophosphatase MutT (NUDIX family)
MYVDRNHTLIEDWDRPGILREDRLNAIDLVHHLELRRIELEKKAGQFPEPLDKRPVAFGIFRALNSTGTSSYLFETNKDWHRLNLIGGKQEPEDGGDFHATLIREIHEELGISPDRVTLSRLTDHPIVSYGLSGNTGSLARYPCMLFGVSVNGEFTIRLKDTWITEEAIRRYLTLPDCPIMVNPDYLAFLLNGSPSRLDQCPLSTSTIVHNTEPIGIQLVPKRTITTRVARYARENKELLAAILTLIAALITVIVAL